MQIGRDRLTALARFEQQVLRVQRDELDDLIAARPELVRAGIVLSRAQLADQAGDDPRPFCART